MLRVALFALAVPLVAAWDIYLIAVHEDTWQIILVSVWTLPVAVLNVALAWTLR